MKKDLLDIICCPTCKGKLKLDIEKQEKDEIIKGLFNCSKCKKTYTIDNGIPNLLPK
jgi:uncharacterized protein YbaR (Trm112 family)